MSGRLESLARGVNRILEKGFENGIFSTPIDSENIGTIIKQMEDGRKITINVRTQRDFGTPYVNGVYVVVTESSGHGTNQDIYYSLDEKGNNFWHIQTSPFLGKVLETRDTSLERLTPYQNEVMDALSNSRKAKRIMQTGFDKRSATVIH